MKDNSPINTIRWFEDLGSEDVPAVGGKMHPWENCNGILTIANQFRDYAEKDRGESKAHHPQFQDRPPVKEPPNEPQKPPVKEPGEPPDPLPPPSRPPVEEPPNEPGKPPVKEPPPKDPNRQPPQKSPVRAGQKSYSLFGACALGGLYGLLIWLTYEPLYNLESIFKPASIAVIGN
jgi:hypothetical protein